MTDEHHNLPSYSFCLTFMGQITPEQLNGSVRAEAGRRTLFRHKSGSQMLETPLPNLLTLLDELWGVIFKFGSFSDFFQFRLVCQKSFSVFWKNVSSLSLRGDNEDAVANFVLSNNPSAIRKLKINKQRTTPALINALTKTPLRNVRALWLKDCTFLDASDLDFISSLHNLNTLYLGGCENLHDSNLENLSKATNLTALSLTHCGNITDMGISSLASRLTNMKTLQINNCPNLTDKAVSALSTLTSLTNLDLSSCSALTDQASLKASTFLQLTRLRLAHCGSISSDGLRNISSLNKLNTLDISDNPHISDTAVHEIAKLSQLGQLGLRATSITDVGLAKLRLITTLQLLNVCSCQNISGVGVISLQCSLRSTTIILGK